MVITITAILIAVLIIIIVTNIGNNSSSNNKKPPTYEPWVIEAPEKRAGRRGEHIATEIIKGVLREGDYLFTNISVSYDGKRTELDNVVVNKYGVFIFEVKNYKGQLYGNEDDYNWEKYKDDGYGNTFVKEVKNPVPVGFLQIADKFRQFLDHHRLSTAQVQGEHGVKFGKQGIHIVLERFKRNVLAASDIFIEV